MRRPARATARSGWRRTRPASSRALLARISAAVLARAGTPANSNPSSDRVSAAQPIRTTAATQSVVAVTAAATARAARRSSAAMAVIAAAPRGSPAGSPALRRGLGAGVRPRRRAAGISTSGARRRSARARSARSAARGSRSSRRATISSRPGGSCCMAARRRSARRAPVRVAGSTHATCDAAASASRSASRCSVPQSTTVRACAPSLRAMASSLPNPVVSPSSARRGPAAITRSCDSVVLASSSTA